MLKSITKLTKDVGLLTVALTLALVANFAYGQWAEPTGTPPTNNTPAPVNVGTSNQVKNGGLSVNALSVIGNSLYNGSYIDFLFNTDSKWRMQRNDGFGNWHTYLNTEGGTSPTHFGSGFALRQTYNTGDGIYQFKSSGATGAAGDAVTWQDTMNIYPDGRVGASQFCDVDGNNCLNANVSPVTQMTQIGVVNHGDTLYPISGYSVEECAVALSVKDFGWLGQLRNGGIIQDAAGNGSDFDITCQSRDDVKPDRPGGLVSEICSYTMVCGEDAVGQVSTPALCHRLTSKRNGSTLRTSFIPESVDISHIATAFSYNNEPNPVAYDTLLFSDGNSGDYWGYFFFENRNDTYVENRRPANGYNNYNWSSVVGLNSVTRSNRIARGDNMTLSYSRNVPCP